MTYCTHHNDSDNGYECAECHEVGAAITNIETSEDGAEVEKALEGDGYHLDEEGVESCEAEAADYYGIELQQQSALNYEKELATYWPNPPTCNGMCQSTKNKKPCLGIQECFFQLIHFPLIVLDPSQILMHSLNGFDAIDWGEEPRVHGCIWKNPEEDDGPGYCYCPKN